MGGWQLAFGFASNSVFQVSIAVDLNLLHLAFTVLCVGLSRRQASRPDTIL